ncbi:Fe-S cluster assembly protein SufB, partial [Candidatus Peregrinibacteria bacterium]|nr:Fe-S cluster assembly protein SufB [Candidatus Peregrinibacteria bacterium]
SNGISTYRGLIKVNKGAENAKIHTSCDSLILNKNSCSDTFPELISEEKSATVAHEATVSKINEDQIFYLMSRGLNREQAVSTIVNGFAEPVIKKLPMEYAVELNRLLELT